jgi:hypothetical protein
MALVLSSLCDHFLVGVTPTPDDQVRALQEEMQDTGAVLRRGI